MTNEEIKSLILLGIGGAAFFISGINGMKDKKKKNNAYHLISINLFINGAFFLLIFLADLIFLWLYKHNETNLSENAFGLLLFGCVLFSLFVTGLHGVMNKKKINNSLFFQLSQGQLVVSIVLGVVLLIKVIAIK